MLRAIQVGLRVADLDYFDMGDIYDLIIESANDDFEYDRIATQDDFDAFAK